MNPPRIIQEILEGLQDVLAPARCMHCMREGSWMCRTCRQHLYPFAQSCVVCGHERSRGLTCFDCSDETPFTGVVSGGPYHARWLRRGIHWLKFKGVRDVSPALARFIEPALLSIAPVSQLRNDAVLIPVPLHPKKLRLRGFNQSEDIARALSIATRIPVVRAVERVKHTHTQTKLPHSMRDANTRDAFALRADARGVLSGKRFLIVVDDVTTTGSTLGAAAAALPASPSQQIWGATVARG